MEVQGTMKVMVEISPTEALNVIRDYLGIENRGYQTELVILEKDHEKNTRGKRALYDIEDTSYHGSFHGKYTFVTDNEEKIAVYEAFYLLKKAVWKDENPYFKN